MWLSKNHLNHKLNGGQTQFWFHILLKNHTENVKNWCFAANILFDKMCDNEGSIKGALVEVINALMSALPNERKLAEQQLDALQVTEGNSFISN